MGGGGVERSEVETCLTTSLPESCQVSIFNLTSFPWLSEELFCTGPNTPGGSSTCLSHQNMTVFNPEKSLSQTNDGQAREAWLALSASQSTEETGMSRAT